MLKKDELKDGNRSAESSIPDSSSATLIADKLGSIDLNASSTTTTATAITGDDFDINDMDDPLAGFEAQRSGIKDLSLK
ncbi:hypothetical protein BGZ46_001759, partial [Entomortierella lignicola]